MTDELKPEERARMERDVFLAINGLPVGVERKTIKNLHLSVYPPDGRVHVSAPLECSEERIRMYVLEKWVWIAEKRRAIGGYSRQDGREYVSGEAHYFRGSLYRLKVEVDNNSRQGVRIDGDYLVLTVREKSSATHRAAIMAAWHKEQLTPIVDGYVRKWQEVLNVKLAAFEIRAMSAKWGTCSKAKGKAIFNAELAKKPLRCVEYVVAHELAHLIERTHNASFKAILDRHFVDWREIKDNLNRFPV
ncbi:MAG: M48 family metallopeptidase [Kiritimatiellia bacterium]